MNLRVYPDAQGQAAGEILDGQNSFSIEACRKEKAIEVIVPRELVTNFLRNSRDRELRSRLNS